MRAGGGFRWNSTPLLLLQTPCSPPITEGQDDDKTPLNYDGPQLDQTHPACGIRCHRYRCLQRAGRYVGRHVLTQWRRYAPTNQWRLEWLQWRFERFQRRFKRFEWRFKRFEWRFERFERFEWWLEWFERWLQWRELWWRQFRRRLRWWRQHAPGPIARLGWRWGFQRAERQCRWFGRFERRRRKFSGGW